MEPLVSICCITYNHSKFIRQAIEGFISQVTDFDFEIIISDDFSNDDNRKVISEYKSAGRYEFKLLFDDRNIGAKQNFDKTIAAARGRYICICEGDDYWNDALKMQKQFDFLETHPDYSMVWHRFNKLFEHGGMIKPDNNEKYFSENETGVEFDFEKFYRGWEIGMQTLMFRRKALDIRLSKKYKYFKDTHVITHLLMNGKGYCLNFFGAVYRIHESGVNTSLTELKMAKVGYLTYYELFYFNRHLEFIRLKFFWYLQNYIEKLLKHQKKTSALYFIIKQFFFSHSKYRLKSNIKLLIKK